MLSHRSIRRYDQRDGLPIILDCAKRDSLVVDRSGPVGAVEAAGRTFCLIHRLYVPCSGVVF